MSFINSVRIFFPIIPYQVCFNDCMRGVLLLISFAVLLPSSVDKATFCTSTSTTTADVNNLTDLSTAQSTSSLANSTRSTSSTSFYTASSSRPVCVFRSHITSNTSKTTSSNTSPPKNPTTTVPSALSAAPNTNNNNSWLAARLLSSGQDIQLVRDVEQRLVINEGFAQERDFAECAPGIISSAYLTNIGITGLGMQRCLMRLQAELHMQCAQVSVVPYSTHSGHVSSGSSNSDSSGGTSKKRKVSLSDENC